MKHADTLIMVGTSYPFTGFLPEKAKTIHIDTDPAQIGKRYVTDIGLAGDADKTLKWLIENVEKHEDHSFLEHHQEAGLQLLAAVYLVHLLEKLLSRINKYLRFVETGVLE